MKPQDSKSKNPLFPFLALISIGVLGMWFGEIWPGRFFWAPALCMGILRAYIVIMGPSIQGSDDLSPEYRKAQVWSWVSLLLFATYLAIMYRNDLASSMHIALQCVNIMLMGAEYTFGQWQANNHRHQAESNELQDIQEELAATKSELSDGRSEIAQLKAEIAGSKKKIAGLQTAANVIQSETVEPIQVSMNHRVIRCPECLDLVPFGNAAKEVSHCGSVIYTQHVNGHKLEPQTA